VHNTRNVHVCSRAGDTEEPLAANNERALRGGRGVEKGELRLRALAYESVYGCTERNWERGREGVGALDAASASP